MGVAAAILAGVLLVGGVVALVVVTLVSRLKRREADFMDALHDEMATSGEHILKGPEKAIYRGSTSGRYSAVKGNGILILTDRRLLFRKLSGGLVEVDVAKVTGTHEAKSFAGGVVGGQVHLVVDTSDPAEVGFFVADHPAWQAALSPRA